MPRFGSAEALARLGADGAHADSVELKALLVPPAGAGRRGADGTSRAHLERAARSTCSTPSRSTWSAPASRSACDAGPAVGSTSSVSARRSGTADDRIPPRGVRVEIDVVPGAVWQDVEVRRDVESAAAAEVIAGMVKPGDCSRRPSARGRATAATRSSTSSRLEELQVHGPLVVRRVKVAAAGLGLRRADLEHFRFPSGARAGRAVHAVLRRRRWARPRRRSSGCSPSGTSRSRRGTARRPRCGARRSATAGGAEPGGVGQAAESLR